MKMKTSSPQSSDRTSTNATDRKAEKASVGRLGKQHRGNTAETRKDASKAKGKKKQSKKIPYQWKPEGMDLQTWQLLLRKQVAREERFNISAIDEENAPGEYRVVSSKNQQEYKVVYRGARSPWNYCSCMDFRTSHLGTCKHIEAVKLWFGGRHHVHREIPPYTSVYIDYSQGRMVRIRIGADHKEEFEALAAQYFEKEQSVGLEPSSFGSLSEYGVQHFEQFLQAAKLIDDTFRCYGDAMAYVLDKRERREREQWVDTLNGEAFKSLLHTDLYPYQVEGIRFAAKAGRAIIADEMGLGKTIQAIGTAQLLRNKGLAGSVLIMCPTSLKYQWKREIERFAGEQAHVIEGDHLKRRDQYNAPEPYKIVSYNAACNDIKAWGSIETDMLIIDEVQRLKNWDTQIARAARKIQSHYAVILSGTPLENRLEELYSVVELVDQYLLCPYYLFRDRYIITDDKGATVGYKRLNEIGERLRSVLIRRRKRDVHLQLPARQDKNLMVPMTREQMAIHDEAQFHVSMLLQKWERLHFMSETDRNRLMMYLQQMRCVCDSTYVLDQKTRYDTKVGEVVNIIQNVIEGGDEKVVVFSQWERMTRIIAQELEKHNIRYEYLHGSVPSKARKDLVSNFTDLPDSRVFLSTDAGSTGLNLQVASVIINVDLPWNPAVLEQRVARIYRIGQQRNIQVVNLVSAGTFEESMLGKLRFKTSMFEGVLDGGEDTIFADGSKFSKMMDELKETMDQTSAETEEQPIDIQEEEAASTHSEDSEAKAGAPEAADDEVPDNDSAPSAVPSASAGYSKEPSDSAEGADATPTNPRKLVTEGVSFLSGLARTLQSPEATRSLVDALVEENPETGEASLKIPVPDKQTVLQVLGLLGKFMGKE